jgi:uncharacterized protein (TIRG00374 family)
MKKKVLLSILVTFALVWLLLSHIDFDKTAAMFKAISPYKVALLVIIYGIYLNLNALRFRLLLHSKKVKFAQLLTITFLHNMYNRILPFRTGEVSYILLLRTKGAAGGPEAAASLLVARIFDYLTVSFMFVSAMLIMDLSGKIQIIAWIMAGFMVFAVVMLAAITLRGNKFFDWLQTLFLSWNIGNNKVLRKIDLKGREVVQSLTVMGNKTTYALTFLLSISIWLSMFYMLYMIVLVLDKSAVGFGGAVIGSTFAVLTNILPIHGVAGFGTIESGWTVGYMLLGMPKHLAIGSGFLMHIFILFSALAYGMIAFFLNSIDTSGNRINHLVQ